MKKHLPALAGFVLLTLVLTFPIFIRIDSAIFHLVGDPLLNSWIWSWEVHSLSTGTATNFFDTNIFFPHLNTLAYSELLLPQLILAGPVILWSRNPILAHNLVLLASFIATAAAVYLLALRLTGSRSAAFVAGIVLAFCPFMIYHVARVQIAFAAGIPVTFLFLHRWLEESKTSDAVWMAVTYALQALGNVYYGIYLTYFGGLYFVVMFLKRRLWRQPRALKQLALAGVVALALIAPFYWHYLPLKREAALSRLPGPPIPITAYLAPSESNRLYGETLKSFGRTEAHLFPGFVAFGLALLAIGSRVKWPETDRARQRYRRVQIIEALIVIDLVLIVLISEGREFEGLSGPLRFRISTLGTPIWILIVLSVLRSWMLHRWPTRCRRLLPTIERPALPILLVASFWLSLGTGFFHLFYRWLPGFDSLRGVSRIHVMFMLAVALLAAEGFSILRHRFGGPQGRIIAGCIPVLILAEYFAAPLPVVAAPERSDFPAQHYWLAEQDPQTTFVAYPLRIRSEELRVYYSTLHWRRSVNGYSGYEPPLYQEIVRLGQRFPTHQAVEDFQALGVDYLIVDLNEAMAKRRRRLLARLQENENLIEVADLDGVRIFSIRPPPRPADGPPGDRCSDLELSGEDLQVRTSTYTHLTERLHDGRRNATWQAPMQPEEWIEVELDRELPICALEIDLGGHARSYPRGYRIEVSRDGTRWESIDSASEYRPTITDFVEPDKMILRFAFPTTRGRWIRIVQTGNDPQILWRVAELRVETVAVD